VKAARQRHRRRQNSGRAWGRSETMIAASAARKRARRTCAEGSRRVGRSSRKGQSELSTVCTGIGDDLLFTTSVVTCCIRYKNGRSGLSSVCADDIGDNSPDNSPGTTSAAAQIRTLVTARPHPPDDEGLNTDNWGRPRRQRVASRDSRERAADKSGEQSTGGRR
jgi:hypothetical protein